MVNLNNIKIAMLCHEVNRAYCASIGDNSQVSWDEAPQWQRDSAVKGVEFCLLGGVTPEHTHENWSKDKIADGWVWGPVKDPEKKEHPCLVPYDQLPIEQKTKDFLFKAVVDANRQVLKPANAQIENNFKYHSPKEGQPEKYNKVRNAFKELAYLIEETCPASRERSVAMTELETANFWANASIARN